VVKGLQDIEPAASLSQAHSLLDGQKSILAEFIAAAAHEMQLSRGVLMESSGVKERAAMSFADITRGEARRIRLGMGTLATIGATSPFVGLFGTVWGIMNSFIGISKSQTTNLAVVAPGIAEALLATAIGLAAAIPAVVFYNLIDKRIADLENEDEFSEAHEINVTPFIDVMLVLLIIFMVAAPLSTVDLPVDLPSSTATPQKKPDKPVYITVKSDLSVAVGETPVKRRDLARTLEALPGAGKDQRLFLRADRAVPYGELMAVLELLRQGGFLKVALVALEGVPDAEGVGPHQ